MLTTQQTYCVTTTESTAEIPELALVIMSMKNGFMNLSSTPIYQFGYPDLGVARFGLLNLPSGVTANSGSLHMMIAGKLTPILENHLLEVPMGKSLPCIKGNFDTTPYSDFYVRVLDLQGNIVKSIINYENFDQANGSAKRMTAVKQNGLRYFAGQKLINS